MRIAKASGILSFLLLALILASPASAQYRCGSCGTITDVDRIMYNPDKGAGGAVLGAIIGGVLGNQIGGGSGRTAATVGGAVAGGLIGHKVDKNNAPGEQEGLRLEIRMDNGSYRTVEIHGRMRLYRGDRVKVRGNKVELL
jgi:outer membrane lipoprotein SlyB